MNILYLLIASAVVIIFYIYNRISYKKNQRRIVQKLQKSWGKAKEEDDFSFDIISRYFDDYRFDTDIFQRIPDSSFFDLDFQNVFKIIDRTVSKVGQQFLYYKIRTIQSLKEVQKFKKLTDFFLNDQQKRQQAQIYLMALQNDNAYNIEALINRPHYSKPAFVKFLPYLSAFAILVIVIGIFFKIPALFLVLIPIFALNLTFHLKNKFHIQYYNDAIQQLHHLINTGNNLASIPGILTHFEDVTFFKSVNRLKRSLTYFNYNNFLSNEVLIIFWLLAEIIKIQFNIEALLFYNMIDNIIAKNKSIDRLFRFVGRIDAAISTANLKSDTSISYCEPYFHQSNSLITKNLININIKQCIPNDLTLNQESLLLTGSNMSGKTTFIKSLAISSILSETLYIAFADKFEIPFLKIYSSIKISDDILNDTSYYLEEVLRIKEFIAASEQDNPCLFVLDEIFKGTNTVERIAGGKAILSYLNRPQHFVLVSTHDIELTDLLYQQNYALYHFTEKIENNRLIFDHKLKSGKLKTRNAIKILKLYNYPESIIEDAQQTVKNFEKK